jgi:hypothetical protein
MAARPVRAVAQLPPPVLKTVRSDSEYCMTKEHKKMTLNRMFAGAVTTIILFELLAGSALAKTQFHSLSSAQAHCPDDNVGRLDKNTGIFYFQDDPGFSKSKHGPFICEHDLAGNHSS